VAAAVTEAVVITGVGTLGSYGFGLVPLAERLAVGTPRVAEVARSAHYHRKDGARTAALVAGEDLTRWLAPAVARRMSPPSKLAVTAARMALEDAGLAEGAASAPVAVVLATAFGPPSFTEKLLKSILAEGPENASPFLFMESVANAPAAQVAIDCGATGPNVTVVQREAGALVALGRGATAVAEGRVARALVGAVDEMTPLVHGVLDRFGALARPCGAAPEAGRPFDRCRNGFLASEGATVLVLEQERAAAARGARILSRVLASGGAFDASASRVGWGRGGAVLGRALSRLLARAGCGPGDVDRIVSGASGSVAGDRLEGCVLRAAWEGTALPPVLAPKGVTGEYGGGFLAATVLATQAIAFGPTPAWGGPDPAIGVIPHGGGPLPAPHRVLASSLASGGAAAWVLLEAP
jgi:3-oxoacyl-[acyl-carrier-protein] synthase II